jgi:hypothetical protein
MNSLFWLVTLNSNLVLFGEQVKKLPVAKKYFRMHLLIVARVFDRLSFQCNASAIKRESRSVKKIILSFSSHLFVPY